MTDTQRFYIIAMLMITAKRRYSTVRKEGMMNVFRTLKRM